ncbi:MAG: hypothetical protein UY85_C0073G0005 [Candidatus Peribacteria bacterium GW2011_GWB1_54_5]|nr:MAG: hypothetical protein UY85_C0073G0005 [Candidatus Peribacteria bacterium GW2011_GWB1_54_5]KKW40633.1 MAG: hypothetical protein UY87_C0016G0023 [Candidatus Peribacteria bacterium GW2011_GWC2_54_8]
MPGTPLREAENDTSRLHAEEKAKNSLPLNPCEGFLGYAFPQIAFGFGTFLD